MLEAVILFLLSAVAGMQAVLLWILWQHLGLLTKIERIWGAWIDTDQVAKPAPMPGTMFVLSDPELAARERLLKAESQDRAAVMGNPKSWRFPPSH